MNRCAPYLVLLVTLGFGCGGGNQKPEPKAARLTAADEILAIASQWSSAVPEQGLMSPPDPVSSFKHTWTSRLTLSKNSGQETLTVDEHVQLRAGGTVDCSTQIKHDVSVRFGHRAGEAAVEIQRPALSTPRTCQGTHPEGVLTQNASAALFVLRADTLVAVDPPLEKRKYLPISE